MVYLLYIGGAVLVLLVSAWVGSRRHGRVGGRPAPGTPPGRVPPRPGRRVGRGVAPPRVRPRAVEPVAPVPGQPPDGRDRRSDDPVASGPLPAGAVRADRRRPAEHRRVEPRPQASTSRIPTFSAVRAAAPGTRGTGNRWSARRPGDQAPVARYGVIVVAAPHGRVDGKRPGRSIGRLRVRDANALTVADRVHQDNHVRYTVTPKISFDLLRSREIARLLARLRADPSDWRARRQLRNRLDAAARGGAGRGWHDRGGRDGWIACYELRGSGRPIRAYRAYKVLVEVTVKDVTRMRYTVRTPVVPLMGLDAGFVRALTEALADPRSARADRRLELLLRGAGLPRAVDRTGPRVAVDQGVFGGTVVHGGLVTIGRRVPQRSRVSAEVRERGGR